MVTQLGGSMSAFAKCVFIGLVMRIVFLISV
jgi:hypothetical protein